MRLLIEQLEEQRNSIGNLLPGAKVAEDERAISAVAADVLQKLQELCFEQKQRVLALLDVRVRVDEEGRLRGSLSARQVESQRKVSSRTSSQESLLSYLPRNYKVYLPKDDGPDDLAYPPSPPRILVSQVSTLH